MSEDNEQLETAPQADGIADEIDAMIAADEAANPTDSLDSQEAGSQAPASEVISDSNLEQSSSESGTSAADKTEEPAPETPAKPEEKPLSNYEKAKQAGREREANAWKKIEDEKKALAEERRLLDQQHAQSQAAKPQQAAPQQKYSKADYKEASDAWKAEADKLEAAGKFEEADQKRALAKSAEEQIAHAPEKIEPAQTASAPAGKMTPQQQAQFNVEMRESWDMAIQEIPALKEQGSAIQTKVASLLKGELKQAFQLPKGPYFVAKLVAAQEEAARVPDLEKTNAQFKQRIAELEEATSLGGGGNPPGSIPETPFEAKSLAEQEAELRQELGA